VDHCLRAPAPGCHLTRPTATIHPPIRRLGSATSKFESRKELWEKQKEEGIESEEDVEAALAEEITSLDRDIEDLDVDWDESRVTPNGLAADDETREKAIAAIGSVAEVVDEMDVGETEDEEAGHPQEGRRGEEGGHPLLHHRLRRHPVEDRRRALWGRQQVPRDLRGHPPDAEGPRPVYPGRVLRIPAQD
jgi:hypothetical protein